MHDLFYTVRCLYAIYFEGLGFYFLTAIHYINIPRTVVTNFNEKSKSLHFIPLFSC